MKNGFRQSMAWLHTWTGLLVGWLLLLIFMAGTASYYREEISRWMRPELPSNQVSIDVAAQRAVDYLQANAAQAGNWFVTLPQPRNPAMQMFWRLPPELADPSRGRRGGFGEATLDPNTGQALKARETRGGDFFYRLHFDLHYIPVLWARYLVGFCAMFMLVAIITGVITHKKIFKDFFTFRKDKGLRSWLDFHNVSAVMALPYHAMITYTGIVVKLVTLALRAHPILNSTLRGGELHLLGEYHIGVAVEIEDGLIVPVIRDADRKSLRAISRELAELSTRARARRLLPEELLGGTFTVSNAGMLGVDAVTPIINPPEVAILGVGRIADRALAVGGRVEARPAATLCLTFDHRVVDGAPASRFLGEMRRLLEDPRAALAGHIE